MARKVPKYLGMALLYVPGTSQDQTAVGTSGLLLFSGFDGSLIDLSGHCHYLCVNSISGWHSALIIMATFN